MIQNPQQNSIPQKSLSTTDVKKRLSVIFTTTYVKVSFRLNEIVLYFISIQFCKSFINTFDPNLEFFNDLFEICYLYINDEESSKRYHIRIEFYRPYVPVSFDVAKSFVVSQPMSSSLPIVHSRDLYDLQGCPIEQFPKGRQVHDLSVKRSEPLPFFASIDG